MARWLILFLISSFICRSLSSPQVSYAAQSQELFVIPQFPTQPPGLLQKETPNYPHCERFFLFEGKKYECDSNLGRDAERLRPILKNMPQALAELDYYQESRQQVRISGYLLTSSAALIGLGLLMSGGNPVNLNTGVLQLGGYVFFTGVTLGIGAIIHSFTAVNTNDKHIETAVQYYNDAYPENPIKLQFKTAIDADVIKSELIKPDLIK